MQCSKTDPSTCAPAVAVVGAGAVGLWLADALDCAGWRVSIVARGSTLAALEADGARVERAGTVRVSRLAAGPPSVLGAQDYVLISVKAQQMPAVAPLLTPLLASGTVVVSAMNGIPWWFFQDFKGPLKDRQIESVDPSGSQARLLPRTGTLGAVVHASIRTTAPGRAHVLATDRLLVGEPSGQITARVMTLVRALSAGGINAEASADIRRDIWSKLWGNMNMNPISALTRSGTGEILADAEVRALCARMMEEMAACGQRIDLPISMTVQERMDVTARLGNFQTSMLSDVESGRPLEIGPQLGAIVEIAQQLGVAAPFCRAVLGLTGLLSARLAAASTGAPSDYRLS